MAEAAIHGRHARARPLEHTRGPGWLPRHRRILAYARPHWPAIALALALSAATAGLVALQPWPLKLLVDHGLGSAPLPPRIASIVAASGAPPDRIAIVVVASLATLLVFAATAFFESWLTLSWSKAGQRMVYGLATSMFDQLQRLSLIFHASRPVGDSLSRVTTDAWTVYTLVDGLLLAPARHLLVLATAGFLAWQLDPQLTLTMLAVVPLLAASTVFFGGRLKRVELRKRQTLSAWTAFVHQILGAIPMVQVFGGAARNRRAFGELATDYVEASRTGAVVTDGYGLVNGIATTAGVALVLFAGGTRVLAQELSLGSLLVFIAYVRSLETASRGLLKSYGQLRGAEAGIDRVCEVLDADVHVEEPVAPLALPPRRPGRRGHVRFERVSFGYVSARPVLNELTLDIAAGETVALVGETGAGKSTLASLLPRFFDPWSGRILLDGVDVRRLRLRTLRDELGLVLQDPFILPLSAAANIAYGRPDAGFEDIVAAASAANAHEFVSRLPQGYDTLLGEGGGGLSGGQRQRIAIARALLKDPRVLILDEPTAALDPENEQRVMEALRRLVRDRTALIIAHRLSTIRGADRIAVLAEGRIAEIGTHAELLRAGGRYARLHALGALGAAGPGVHG